MAAFPTDDKRPEAWGGSAAPGLLSFREQCVVAAGLLATLLALPVALWQTGGCRGGLADYDHPPRRDTRFRIDVNTASRAELLQLPGVGPTLADRILAIRGATGPFASMEALADVPGIGDATLARIRPYIQLPSRAPNQAPSPPAHDVRTGEPLPSRR